MIELQKELFAFWWDKHTKNDLTGDIAVGEELAEISFKAGMLAQMAKDQVAAFERLLEEMKQ